MPLNTFHVMVQPVPSQTVYLNMNKIMKYVKSKQGIEAARRYEDNMRHIDFWHPQDAKEIKDESYKSLTGYIKSVLGSKLSSYEQTAMAEQIRYNVVSKINAMINSLEGIDLYNVGLAGEEVLKCAMERDKHLNILEGILNEAKRNGQKTLNSEQTMTAEKELKMAVAFDNRRKDYAQARLEAMAQNREIAKEKGSEVLAAFEYLYGVPAKR